MILIYLFANYAIHAVLLLQIIPNMQQNYLQ